jgi:hypothetical protein
VLCLYLPVLGNRQKGNKCWRKQCRVGNACCEIRDAAHGNTAAGHKETRNSATYGVKLGLRAHICSHPSVCLS